MVNEFCGFKHGVIGTDKMPADTTLNNMKKADLIKLLHTAQHNYETLMWFYNNAVKANMSQLNNNGWIPCSDAVPQDGDWVLCYGTNREGRIKYEVSTYAHEIQCWMCSRIADVIAWQPLPAPFKPKGE